MRIEEFVSLIEIVQANPLIFELQFFMIQFNLNVFILSFLGKTSLAKSLIGQSCCDNEKTATIGMDMFSCQIQDTDIVIIDCAGENKYVLTHQLFLSSGN